MPVSLDLMFPSKPFSSFRMLICFPAASTCIPALTETGVRMYSHLATTKVPTAQAQTMTAIDDVTNSVGVSTKRPTPIQKRLNTIALPSATAMQPREKAKNKNTGKKDQRTCVRRNDYKPQHARLESGSYQGKQRQFRRRGGKSMQQRGKPKKKTKKKKGVERKRRESW